MQTQLFSMVFFLFVFTVESATRYDVCKRVTLRCPEERRVYLNDLFPALNSSDPLAFICTGEYSMECTRIGQEDECFAGENTVITDQGPKFMRDLKVGDKVKDASDRFVPVIGWLHRNTQKETKYIALTDYLKVTPFHIALVERDGRRVEMMAHNIRPGDKVGDNLILSRHTEVSRGLYAPLTASGTIVVSGGTFSCYSDLNWHTGWHYVMKALYYAGLVETRDVDTEFTTARKFSFLIPSFLRQ